MRRFLFFTLEMVIFFATMVCAAILHGHTQPPSVQIASLHLQDCDPPCWMGITPGVTDITQAKSVIMSAFPDAKIDPLYLQVKTYTLEIYL